MSNCSNHKKEVLGISDMKILAEMIGDLHYETLGELLDYLCLKIYNDSVKDKLAGKERLSINLKECSLHIGKAYEYMNDAWKISKPFMNKTTINE